MKLTQLSSNRNVTKKLFGLSFRKTQLLTAALTHPSYRNENICPPLENFDRLEFFGDTILNFIICRQLYDIFPDANEGLLSRMRSILVSRKILCRISSKINIRRHLKVGKSLIKQSPESKAKIYADSLEALIAALYFDQGLASTQRFILKHFASYLDTKRLFRLDPNPKSALQEFSQKQWKKLPVYANKQTKQGIKTIVSIGRKRKALASAKTRRLAEAKAARILLRQLRHELASRSKKRSSGKKLRKIL